MKITFLGAGSTVFSKNVLGDIILTPEIQDAELALYDIDENRLNESYSMLNNILSNSGRKDIVITKYLNLKDSLKNADFAINAIQVGGYEPCTVTDFEIPKKYGLRQTIADTLGIGGIFRALRTIPVMKNFTDVMEEVCPNVLFLNYTNPMAILSGYIQRYTKIQTVGLCHSVQVCADVLLDNLDMSEYKGKVKWQIAGINHQAWLLKIEDLNGNDLYPEIKKRALEGVEKHPNIKYDLVRLEMMKQFGYYITESSEHTSEYLPYFIKSKYPELIDRFNIPLDEYPRRCINQIKDWETRKHDLVNNKNIEHHKSHEYAANIIKAVVTDNPYKMHGNVLNTGLITNLPSNACVEVPVMVDRNKLNPCFVGDLPEQCAAINRTNINVQLMTIEAARTLKKDYIYMAAMLDPHTSSELSIDDIRNLCDDLIEAHGNWLPKFN
ncbi:MAG TPA: alpha-glucosidase/alpha-galactosidase [Clostridia bacterium]